MLCYRYTGCCIAFAREHRETAEKPAPIQSAIYQQSISSLRSLKDDLPLSGFDVQAGHRRRRRRSLIQVLIKREAASLGWLSVT